MKKMILAAVAAMSVSGAWAQVYMGGGLSMSRINIDCTSTLSCAQNDAGGKVWLGYVGKSGIGFEGQYHNLGGAQTKRQSGSNILTTDYEASAFGAAAVFRGAISRNFWVHAKFGLNRVTVKANAHDGVTMPTETTESSTKPYMSFGVEYGFVENVKLMAYLDMTKAKIGGTTASIKGPGLAVEFVL